MHSKKRNDTSQKEKCRKCTRPEGIEPPSQEPEKSVEISKSIKIA